MLVQRDGEHPGVGVESALHAVAVVHVHVDVGDPVETVVEQPGDGHRRVVVHAETRSRIGHRVMHATADAHRSLGASLRDGHGRGQSAADDRGRGLVHARKHRIVRGAEAVGRGGRRTHRRHGAFHRVEVVGRVDAQQLRAAGLGGLEQFDTLEQAEALRERHGELQARGLHRMLRRPGVIQEALGPDDRRGPARCGRDRRPRFAARCSGHDRNASGKQGTPRNVPMQYKYKKDAHGRPPCADRAPQCRRRCRAQRGTRRSGTRGCRRAWVEFVPTKG